MNNPIEVRVTREVRAMTRREVLLKAIEGRITWLQAADICGMTPRHMRRLRHRYEEYGFACQPGTWVTLQTGHMGNTRIGS